MEDIKIAEVIGNTRHILELLETVKSLMKEDYVKSIDYGNGCQVVKDSYKIDTLINEMQKGIEVFKTQSLCEHKNTTGLILVGNDSHYKYFHNTCKDCDFILETDEL